MARPPVHADFPDRDIELDQRIKDLLFRAVKELLINVVKHSHTHQARLIVG